MHNIHSTLKALEVVVSFSLMKMEKKAMMSWIHCSHSTSMSTISLPMLLDIALPVCVCVCVCGGGGGGGESHYPSLAHILRVQFLCIRYHTVSQSILYPDPLSVISSHTPT